MSRIGKLPISIPTGVTVEVKDGVAIVTGSKGTLSQPLFAGLVLKQEDSQVSVVREVENIETQKQFGLLRTLIANMIQGVSEGFSKTLEINGVGYRAAAEGRGVSLSLGYSHKISYQPPEGVDLKVEGNKIIVSGFDKQQVGEAAAKIRSYRKPEPYKGKGIKYAGEHIRRKAGKTAAKG
jgi:large subunit ribosomal protein L6